MNYEFFYDLGQYANRNWGGGFSEKDIAGMAYDNLCEWEATVSNGKPTHNMQVLINVLVEDVRNGNEEAKEYLDEIRYQITERRVAYE